MDEDCGGDCSSNTDNNSKFVDGLFNKSKKSKMGIFSWFCIFALMGNYGMVLSTMVFLNPQSSVFLHLDKRMV